MVKIAVEEPLTDVMQELKNKGYNAEILDRKVDAASYDCVVVRAKQDLADMHMNTPLVEARGRSVNEIVEEVGERLQRSGKKEMTMKMKKKQGGSSKHFLCGMAAGVAVGATAGLMAAPKEGKQIRTELKSTATQTKDKATQVKEKATGMKDKAKEMAPGAKKKDEPTREIAPKETAETKPKKQ